MERKLTILIDNPITHESISESLLEQFGFENDGTLYEFLSPTRQTEFCISGKSYSAKPILASPVARENYLYVQSLTIIAADHRYYTRRYQGDSFLLLYTVSGEGRLEYEGKTYLLQEGDGFWIDCSKEQFYCTVGKEWTHIDTHFLGRSADAFYNEYVTGHPPVFHEVVGGTFHRELEQLLDDYELLSYGREVRINNDLSNLLTKLIVESDAEPSDDLRKSLQESIRFLETHLSEPITLDQLAEMAHLNKYHFAHEFRRLTGYSPIDYLIHLRLEQACLLLQNTKLPINRIAELVGVPNNQYFGKLFKKKMGMTPGEYRRAV